MSLQNNTYMPYVPHSKPWLTILLMLSCMGIFGYINLLSLQQRIDVNALLYIGGVSREFLGHGLDSYVRFISAGFLHANTLHLLMNMYALWIVGTKCERYYGKGWYLVIYVLSLIGSSYFSIMLHEKPTISVGASGAIMGLFAADLVLAKYFNPHKSWLSQDGLSILILNLIPGIIPNLDYWGHLGGAITGGVASLILTKILWRICNLTFLDFLASLLGFISLSAIAYTALYMVHQYQERLFYLKHERNEAALRHGYEKIMEEVFPEWDETRRKWTKDGDD